MSSELAFVIINPYTIAKSRTGGVIGRFLSRTGLDLVAARLFSPPDELVEDYIKIVRQYMAADSAAAALLTAYIRKAYGRDPRTGRTRRAMMILLEGENAIQKVREVTGPLIMGGSESVRDTYGDYVTDENKRVQYFEPAVLIASTPEETGATLRLWARFSERHGGWVHNAADVNHDSGWERTLVLIKPDNFRFPNARPGNIVDVLSRSGLRIVAAKIHRMSVAEAENFYGPVRSILREKMKKQAAERAKLTLEAEFEIILPDALRDSLGETLGPLVGDEQFNQIVKFMTGFYPPSCPPEDRAHEGLNKCLALVYGGINAISKIRNLLGSTDPSKAATGSVRREFGRDIMVNAAHASDSVENAEREIGIIKIDEDLISPWVARYYPG